MISYLLPFPPSTNNLFSGQRRRFRSRTYDRWLAHAGAVMARQRVPHQKQPVRIEIELTPPDARHRDIDNYHKAIIDLAVKMGVISDDSRAFVRGVAARWSDQPGQPGARVTITPA